jgi:hypothetical protein
MLAPNIYKRKQNKHLTEETKKPYGRLQLSTSKKKEETTKTTTAKHNSKHK